MDGLSTDPNEALVFHFNRNSQDKLSGSACVENEPLDVSRIISSDGAGSETGHSAVEKVEIWVNGVKRVIFVPLGNNSTEPCNPSERGSRTERQSPNEVGGSFAAADPNPPSPVTVDPSSCSRTESYSRLTYIATCAGENTVLSKSVSTNTVDQLPNRCVATVAPQINHELGRLLVSSAFDVDVASKSRESSYKQAAALIKQEKPTSLTNCLNVGRESVEASSFGANVGHHHQQQQQQQQQPFVHQIQHPPSEHQRLLNLNEYHYQDRQNHLQRLGYNELGRLPMTNSLTRNTLPHPGLYANASDGGYPRYALPTADSFAGHHRLPMQMAPYLLNPLQATVLSSNSLGPGGSIPGRAESNQFPSLLGMGEPAVGSNRSAHVPMPVPNATALLGNPTVMVPLQRYRHLLATLDPNRHPYTYGRFVAPDGAQLHNVYAPLARFPTRADFPQFPVRLSSNEQAAAQIVRGDFLHPQFPLRLPPPINDKLVPPVTSFDNGYRFLGHHPNYASSFVHAQNQARHELHIPSSIAFFNEQQASKIFLSEAGQHLQGVGIGPAAHTSLNFKQPETVPGGNLTAQRVHQHQNQSKVSPAVSEMSQVHLLPASSLHYGNLRGCEQPILRVPNLLGCGLPSEAVSQSFRSSPAGLAHHETTKSSTFQPMNGNLSNNSAPPQDVQQFMRAPYTSAALSQGAVSCSQTDSLSRCVAVPGLRATDEQNGSSSLAGSWYSSPSDMVAFSQNLLTQSFLSASPGIPGSHNRFAGYWPRFFPPGVQTALSSQALPLSSTPRSQSDVGAENHAATELQSRLSSLCSSIQVDNTFRNCYGNCMEAGNRTFPVLHTSSSSQALHDPQSSVSAESAVSTVLTSTNKGCDKSVDGVILADSNNESSKSADGAVKDRILPLRSSDTVLDASHETLPERTTSPSLQRRLEPSGAEPQGPQSQAVSQPGSPQSPMSEIMNSIDKISDDLSMQKWLDSLIGNISDSSKDGFDSQAKSKSADLPAVSQTSSKDTTTGADGASVCARPSMAKQVDFKKTKRTWIGIKSIEAEMSPKSSDVKTKRRKRRRLTLKSNQSPEGSCDASSDSWHPDSFGSSESSVDSHLTSIPSTPDSCSDSSWLSNDSVTIGKRRKKRSRKSTSSKRRTVHSRRRRRARRSHNLSPWRRTRPCSDGFRGCFVSLEVLRLKRGETWVNVNRASEFLCCSSKTKGHRTDRSGSDTEESYGSWCPFKRKKHFLKRGSKRTRSAVRSGSETEDSLKSSRSSRQRSKKKRYSKPARNVVLSGSDTE